MRGHAIFQGALRRNEGGLPEPAPSAHGPLEDYDRSQAFLRDIRERAEVSS